MLGRIRTVTIAALAWATAPAWAVDTTLLPSGYTGLGLTPTAQILDWGQAAAAYERQVAGNPARIEGHDMALGFGLLPNLEVVGRFATNSLHENCFSSNCGVRHLIAAGKASIPLDRESRWRIGAGAVDAGGATNYFRTFYGVLTYDNGPLQASVGGAHRAGSGVAGSRSPLGGAFGSIAWQPIPLVRGQVEVSGRNAWAGVRVFIPAAWLPSGWTLSAGANARLNDNALTKRNWWDVSLSIPLYKIPEMPRSHGPAPAPSSVSVPTPASIPVPVPAPTPPIGVPPQDSPPAAPTDSQLADLAVALEARGFEDIFVGRMPDGTIAVRVNNGTFRRNTVDGLGAALGVVARQLAVFKSGYRLVLTQRQIPFVAVTGQADCLRQWIAGPTNTCAAGELSTPASGAIGSMHEGVTWVVSGRHPAWQTVRVKIGPALRTKVGTEFGAVDLDVGVNIDAELPLWRGASVDWGVNVPVAHSRNYEPNAIFGNLRIQSGTERVAFTQTVPLRITGGPSSPVLAQVTAGRIGNFYDGALGSLRWEPGEGRHRFSASAGAFRNNRYDGGFGPLGTLRQAYPAYASYRYSVMPTRTDVEATAGQFMNNDRGFQIGMRQWFNDASVGLYYKRTRDVGGGPVQQLIGVELSLRLGPRQDSRPTPHVQVGGSDRFAHSFETTIREPGSNPLRLGRAMQAPTPDLNIISNLDRSGLAYFEDNMPRIREAARR